MLKKIISKILVVLALKQRGKKPMSDKIIIAELADVPERIIMGEISMPIIIFELGTMQVFHFQTANDLHAGKPFADLYWKDRRYPGTHGPFGALHTAMDDYAFKIKGIERSMPKIETNNVIEVNFFSKKRVSAK